jgi:hypothetical protein
VEARLGELSEGGPEGRMKTQLLSIGRGAKEDDFDTVSSFSLFDTERQTHSIWPKLVL